MSRQTARLEEVHAQLGEHCGTMGVRLVAHVLAFGMTIESAAVARRGGGKQALRFWSSFFRQCLRHLSVVLGLATATASRPGAGAPRRPNLAAR
jgi:hypothetical protein